MSGFGDRGLKTKLVSLFLVMATLTAMVGTSAYFCLTSVITKFQHITKESFPSAMHLESMRGHVRSARIAAISLGIPDKSDEQRQDLVEKLADAWAKFDAEKKAYVAGSISEDEHKLLLASESSERKIRDLSQQIEKLSAIEDADDDTLGKLYQLINEDFNTIGREYTVAINPLIDYKTKQVESLNASAEAAVQGGIWAIVGLTVATFVFAAGVGLGFSGRLARTYQDLATKLGSEAASVTMSSEGISQSGAALSAATTQQASAIQETVASIDEVNAMVAKNAQNAKRSLTVAKAGDDAAQSGKEDVVQMLKAINEISISNAEIMEQSEASNKEFAGIVSVIAEIGNKTKVINDIVFQTKLLSFNASVEAARAGDQGKGFAVVAEEVGKLAQMSGDAAKEISQLLQDSMHKVEATVTSSKSRIERLIGVGKSKVEAGLATAHRCDKSLEEIVRRVQELTQMVDEIATASDEQAKGVEEITKAMGQMDMVTQQNASSAQNSAQVARQLNEQSATLKMLVHTLEATVHGKNGTEASTDLPLAA